jgi:hypothetical protein
MPQGIGYNNSQKPSSLLKKKKKSKKKNQSRAPVIFPGSGILTLFNWLGIVDKPEIKNSN